MLWTIFVVLLVMWLLGFSFHVGGGLIHLLLVVCSDCVGVEPAHRSQICFLRRPNRPNL